MYASQCSTLEGCLVLHGVFRGASPSVARGALLGPVLPRGPVAGASSAVGDADVATLVSFGFLEVAARNALAHCVRTALTSGLPAAYPSGIASVP